MSDLGQLSVTGEFAEQVPTLDATRRSHEILALVLVECEAMIQSHNASTQEPGSKMQISDIQESSEGLTSFWIKRLIQKEARSVRLSAALWPSWWITVGYGHEVEMIGGRGASTFRTNDNGLIGWPNGTPPPTLHEIAECACAKVLAPVPPRPESVIRAYEVIAGVFVNCTKMVDKINASSQDIPLKISNLFHYEGILERFWVMRETGYRAVLVSRDPGSEGHITISMPRENAERQSFVVNHEGQIRPTEVIFEDSKFKRLTSENLLTPDDLSDLAIESVLGTKYPKYLF
jgi:hypothetical protein